MRSPCPDRDGRRGARLSELRRRCERDATANERETTSPRRGRDDLRGQQGGASQDGLPAGLPVAREPEVVPLACHAIDDPADTGPASEVLADAGDHRGLAAGRVVVAECRQHGEQDPAALGEGAGRHSISSPPVPVLRARIGVGVVRAWTWVSNKRVSAHYVGTTFPLWDIGSSPLFPSLYPQFLGTAGSSTTVDNAVRSGQFSCITVISRM